MGFVRWYFVGEFSVVKWTCTGYESRSALAVEAADSATLLSFRESARMRDVTDSSCASGTAGRD